MSVIDSQHVGNAFLLEFPIPGRDSARPARECVRHIEGLFSVQVSAPGTQTSQGEWIAVQGRQQNIAKAKRYILALCVPEVRVEASQQPHFARLLFNGGSRVRLELERDYQTVLSSDANGAIHVQGAESDVYATIDKLSSLEALHINGTPHPTPSHLPLSTVAASTSVQTTYSTRDTDRPQQYHNTRQPQYESHQPLYGQVLPRGTDPRREKRIDYFVSLGYTREKVEGVLCALPDAADDVILNRLVQCTPRSRPPVDLADVSMMDPQPVNPESLRHIVIDGSNVAMRHGNGVFSCKGIQLAVDYFKKRGHTNITVFVPEWRKEASTPDNPITDQHILFSLEQKGHLKYTPSRKLPEGRRIVCYDDRFIVKLATDEQGVIVSNDQFRDLVNEKAEWKETIETRLLQFTFANDYFMPPDDPLGRNGPSLDQLLSKDPHVGQLPRVARRSPAQSNLQICPHLERCTFGKKCKYWHPERDPSSSSGSNSSHTPSTSRSPTPSPSPDKRYMLQSTRSREDLRPSESNFSNTPADISLADLGDRMSGMSLHSKPEPPQYINLQQPSRLQEYPQQVMRSTPTLPGPDPSMLAPPEPGPQERRQYTFPLMNLSHGPPSYVERPKGVTEDFTQLAHRHHARTPSHHHRAHTHEHELRYDAQQIGLPGPHHQSLMPRDPTLQRDGPAHYMRYSDQRDHYRQPLPPHATVQSSSYPLLPRPHNTPPPRTRTQSDYGSQRYDSVMFEKASAVLPNCEDRLRRVFAQYPGISWQDAVAVAQSMD